MAWPPTGFTLRWFGEAIANPADPRSVPELDAGRTRRRGDRPRPRHAGRHGGPALRVLRAELDQLPARPADRPARRGHGHRPEHDVPDPRDRLRADDDHHRSRHVLRRHRLQQRDRPPPAAAAVARGGVGRPRCGYLDHVPRGSRCPGCAPRSCRARCSPSHSRSTRSSSPCSPRAPGTQTIPIFVLAAMQRPTELPVVNVVALVLIAVQRDPGLHRPAHQRRRRRGGRY